MTSFQNKTLSRTSLLLLTILFGLVSACSSKSSNNDNPNPTGATTYTAMLSISPTNVQMTQTTSQTFTAMGGTAPYTYSISPSNFGSIDPQTGVFTSPSSDGSVTVCVKDSANSPTACATVTVSGQNSALVMTPSQVAIPITTSSHTSTYTFMVTGGKSPYVFAMVTSASTGSIDNSTGLYTAPTSTGTAQIKATDALGQIVYGYITLTSASGFSISPATVTIAAGASFTFQATGGTAPYTFSVLTANGGSIDSSSGDYRAPSSYSSSSPIQVQARDAAGTTSVAFVTIGSGGVTGNLKEIYELYSSQLKDHLYGTDPNEGLSYGYQNTLGGNPAFQLWSDGNQTGTVALFRCRTNTIPQRHFISLNSSCPYIVNGGVQSQIFESILGYMQTSQITGTVPLYTWVSPNGLDQIITISTTEGQSLGYYFGTTLGYVVAP